jgi:hypothetical protein
LKVGRHKKDQSLKIQSMTKKDRACVLFQVGVKRENAPSIDGLKLDIFVTVQIVQRASSERL